MDELPPRYTLKRLLAVTTAIAALLGCYVWFQRARGAADMEAIRQAYIRGRLTKEQTRDIVGSRVEAWSKPER